MDMKKLLKVAVPVAVIGFFILIMNSDFLFREPDGYHVPSQIENITESILRSDWSTADTQLNEMDTVLKETIFPLIQFSVEKDEMIQIDLSIARIRGCIQTRNRDLAVVYLQDIKSHWNNLNK